MILSKANLTISSMTKADKNIPALDTLHIREDGTTVAANGSALVAVSPVNRDIKSKVPLDESEMLGSSTVYSDTVKEVIKNMPKDSMFGGVLEHCDFKNVGGEFTLTDGKRTRKISGKIFPREYIDYKAIFERAHSERSAVRVAVNLKRLRAMLESIDSAVCDTSTDAAVFIEFTDANTILLRARNERTEQNILCVMTAYNGANAAWQDYNEWEKSLLEKKIVTTTTATRKIKRERSK